MKALAKQLMPPLLVTALKRIHYKPPSYSGLDNLDQKLEQYLNFNNGYFVELGANDGINQSNTLYYERYKHWRGVLIEPAPHNYLLCRQHRSPANHIVCNACTSFDYKEQFVEIAYSDLMSAPIGLESDIPNPLAHAKEGRQFLHPFDEHYIFGALAKPLNAILAEANAPSIIDFLSLDVEGAEMEVLKGIDHREYKFRFMCIESRSPEKLLAYLARIGYHFIEQLSSQDYLFAWP